MARIVSQENYFSDNKLQKNIVHSTYFHINGSGLRGLQSHDSHAVESAVYPTQVAANCLVVLLQTKKSFHFFKRQNYIDFLTAFHFSAMGSCCCR
jgi:hypothetical protein